MADTASSRERPLSCPVSLSDRKLSAEKLPLSEAVYSNSENGGEEDDISDDVIEDILTRRAKAGDSLAKFQLGQFFFERQIYDKALVAFERIKGSDVQAKYQLGVMYYDGLGATPDPVSTILLPGVRPARGWKLLSSTPQRAGDIVRKDCLGPQSNWTSEKRKV